MKPLSIRWVAMAASCLLICSAFVIPAPRPTRAHPGTSLDATYYYYTAGSDAFDAYNTQADEIVRLETMTGVYVNTSPFGGTLLVRGYVNNILPHNVWPSSYLYAHY